ncbi:MAG TPA: CDP-alcohol phosphatidyltransferase family protein [Bryobacteraceae bacterium]|nr:CDP-alcohol phosphatidyltransferase family protein [Bryobacteraceae bacterium]
MPSWLNLANCITLLRLVLVPFVITAILGGQHLRAAELFALAAVTDVLDGAAARRLRLASQTGAYLDPIADKCLLSGVFVALAAVESVPWWFVAVVFGRDLYILMAVGLMMAFTHIRKFPPSVWGKVCTFVQICAAVVWMARNIFTAAPLGGLSTAMLWISAAATVWSGIHYTWRGIQVLRARPAGALMRGSGRVAH